MEPFRLALPPQNNQAFFREVDEEVRRDRWTALWRRHGTHLLIGVGVLLVVLAAVLWWFGHRRAQADRDAEALTAVLQDAQANRAKPTDPRLALLARSPRAAYRALGALTAADLLAGGDPKAAAARLRAVAGDAGLPQPFRDLALIRATTLDFDALPPSAVVAAMRPLAQPGAAWFGSAAELTALADLRMNRRDLAGPLFAAIVRDPASPQTLRARAAGMANSLGQDVATSAPAAPKE